MASDDEKGVYIQENCASDLAFLFAESELDLKWQYEVVKAGYKTIARYVGLEDSKEKLREVFKSDFGLDAAADPASRLQVTISVNVWEHARAQAKREAEVRAEASALGLPKPVQAPERTAMHQLVEKKFGKLSEDEVPGPTYLTSKAAELEQNDPQASPMDEVVSIEDGDDWTFGVSSDAAGAFRTVRKTMKVSFPASPEEYRKRLRVEANVWLFLATKHTNRPWLSDLIPADFEKLAKHILGKKVAEFEIILRNGQKGPKVPWEVVLKYELEVRKMRFT